MSSQQNNERRSSSLSNTKRQNTQTQKHKNTKTHKNHGTMNPLPFAQRSTSLSDRKNTETTVDVRIRPIPGMGVKPKRPRTAYNLFFKDQQANSKAMRQAGAVTAGHGSQDMSSLISECWKNISPSQRMHYNRLAVEDKFRHYREKAEYRERMDRGQHQNSLSNNKNNTGAFERITIDKPTCQTLDRSPTVVSSP